mmetsp:Transcript_1318/g.825  ORF Transcript_1318/g.825 Transcript_1318/m.825 type:complete len:206 (-) Transcript_1318:82-699(-)
MRDSIQVSILIHSRWISSIAGASVLAVNQHLWRKSMGSIEDKSFLDVESVCQGRGGSLSPAGAAILRNVLVHVPRNVVAAIGIAPVPTCREELVLFPWKSLWENNSVLEKVLRHSVASLSRDSKKLWLRHAWVVKVIARIINLFLSRFVHSWLRKRNCPGAVTLNSNVVDSSDNTHEAVFSPVSSPRVSHMPVFSTIFIFSPANH